MDPQQPEWQPLGTHLLRVLDDVLYLKVRGSLEVGDVRALVKIGAQQIAAFGYYLSVVDATKASTMTAEARRYNAEWIKDNPDIPGSSVVFGAGPLARTIITMINRATTLLSMRPVASHFVKDEAEALAWVQEERQRLKAQTASRQNKA